MFKNIIKTIIIALCLAAMTFNAYAYNRGDFQIWNTDVEEVKIYKDVKFAMEQEFRFGGNASELYYQHYEWGFLFGFARMLDIYLNYRQVFEISKKKWMEEDQPNVVATIKLDIWRLKFDDRNRIEYRHFRYQPDSIRYRNRFTLKYPIYFDKITIAPYIANEIFISSNGNGYSENRFCPGLEFELTKYSKADIYYMLKSNKLTGGKWTDANVLGTKIKISF